MAVRRGVNAHERGVVPKLCSDAVARRGQRAQRAVGQRQLRLKEQAQLGPPNTPELHGAPTMQLHGHDVCITEVSVPLNMRHGR